MHSLSTNLETCCSNLFQQIHAAMKLYFTLVFLRHKTSFCALCYGLARKASKRVTGWGLTLLLWSQVRSLCCEMLGRFPASCHSSGIYFKTDRRERGPSTLLMKALAVAPTWQLGCAPGSWGRGVEFSTYWAGQPRRPFQTNLLFRRHSDKNVPFHCDNMYRSLPQIFWCNCVYCHFS